MWIVCGLRSQVALRTAKNCKTHSQKSELAAPNMRIFAHNTALVVLRATKTPADARQFTQFTCSRPFDTLTFTGKTLTCGEVVCLSGTASADSPQSDSLFSNVEMKILFLRQTCDKVKKKFEDIMKNILEYRIKISNCGKVSSYEDNE